MKKKILFFIMVIISTKSVFCSKKKPLENNNSLPMGQQPVPTTSGLVLPRCVVQCSALSQYLSQFKSENYSLGLSLLTRNDSCTGYLNPIKGTNFPLKNLPLFPWSLFKTSHLDNSAMEEVRFSEILNVPICDISNKREEDDKISTSIHDMIPEKPEKIIISSISKLFSIQFQGFFNHENGYFQSKRLNACMLKNYFLCCRVVSIPRNPVPFIDALSEQQNKSKICELIFYPPVMMELDRFKDCQESSILKEIESLKYCESGEEKNIEKTDCEVQTDENIQVEELDREKLQEYKDKVAALEKEIHNLQNELEVVKNESQQGKEREKELQQRLPNLEKELESLLEKLENLHGECKKISDEKVVLENASREQNLQKEENNKLVTELTEKIALLQEELTNLKSESQEKEKKKENLTRDLEALKQQKDLQNEEYTKEKESLNNQLSDLKKQLLELKNKLKELTENKAELENKLQISAGEKEEIKNNLEKEKIQLQTQIEDLGKKFLGEKSNLENELVCLKKDLDDLQNKKDLQSEEDKKNQLNLEDKLVKLKNELEAVEKEFKELEKNKLELEEKLKEKENLDEDVKEIDNLKLNINNQKNDIKKNISLFRKIIGFRSDDYKKKKEELKKLETNYQEKKENLLKKFLSEWDIQEMEEKKRIIEEAGVFCKIKSFFNPQNNYNKSKEHLENMYHKIVSNHLTIYQAIPDEYQTFLIVDKDRNFVFQIKDIFMSKSLLTKIMFLSAPVISCGFCGWLAFSKSTFSSAINSFSGVINSCIERYNLKEKYPDILKYFGFLFATKKCGDLVLRVVSSENPCVFYVSQQCANNINRGTRFCEKCVKNQQLACMRENYLKANHLV